MGAPFPYMRDSDVQQTGMGALVGSGGVMLAVLSLMPIFQGMEFVQEKDVPPNMKIAPYGRWPSPISAELALESSIHLQVYVRPADNGVVYSILKPREGGRTSLVYSDGCVTRDLLPPSYDARSSVHQYGGCSFEPVPGGVCFVNFSDQCVYFCSIDGLVHRLTEPGPYRHADLTYHSAQNRLICVREVGSFDAKPKAELVALPLDPPTAAEVLFSGPDFIAGPALSPDGTQLAWISWDHPLMPWDSTTIWRADASESELKDIQNAILETPQAVMEPRWSIDNRLLCISDADGWWNLYTWPSARQSLVQLTRLHAEIGAAPWFLGARHFDFVDKDTVVACVNSCGKWQVGTINLASGKFDPSDVSYAQAGQVCTVPNGFFFFAATEECMGSLYHSTLRNSELLTTQTVATTFRTDHLHALSRPQTIKFPTTDNEIAHGFLYLPYLEGVKGPSGIAPPLLVLMHGGPTTATSARYNGRIQYLTSRGIAVLDINYRGSTGFGRSYRMSLYGKWGVSDVDDSCAGANFLAMQGLVDGQRMAIAGASAGGYSALAAAAFQDTFVAASSHYGVSDLSMLAHDTHKFESCYIERLVGLAKDGIDPMNSRSPINSVENIDVPIILFQGLDDLIVPPNQSELMVGSLISRGIDVEYHAFSGESHGFRKAETLQHVLEKEYEFLLKVFEA